MIHLLLGRNLDSLNTCLVGVDAKCMKRYVMI